MINIIRFPVRALFFVIGLVAFCMEIAADWLIGARDRTEYVRTGACNRCGNCCQCLALEMPKWLMARQGLIRFFVRWHKFAMNFHLLAIEEDHLLYRCGYYEAARGCTIHPFRHRICRFFPRQRLYGHPELDPKCGYGFTPR